MPARAARRIIRTWRRRVLVPRHCGKQFWGLEQSRGRIEFRAAAALLPDELVLRNLRDKFSGTFVDRLPVPSSATPADFNMRMAERVEERTRIARELHDTLLQSFQG